MLYNISLLDECLSLIPFNVISFISSPSFNSSNLILDQIPNFLYQAFLNLRTGENSDTLISNFEEFVMEIIDIIGKKDQIMNAFNQSGDTILDLLCVLAGKSLNIMHSLLKPSQPHSFLFKRYGTQSFIPSVY